MGFDAVLSPAAPFALLRQACTWTIRKPVHEAELRADS